MIHLLFSLTMPESSQAARANLISNKTIRAKSQETTLRYTRARKCVAKDKPSHSLIQYRSFVSLQAYKQEGKMSNENQIEEVKQRLLHKIQLHFLQKILVGLCFAPYIMYKEWDCLKWTQSDFAHSHIFQSTIKNKSIILQSTQQVKCCVKVGLSHHVY